MKKIKYIFIFLIAFTANVFSNDALQKAEKAYDTKNYKEAISRYHELIKDGFKSYQLYFNIANSYYKNNQLGQAIYYYELARKINPNDEDVRINLGIASSKTTDKIDAKENFFISAVKSNVLSSFSTASWAWFSIFSLIIACFLFFIYISSSNIALKRISFLVSCVLVIGFVLTYSLGYSALKSKSENKFAIITAKEIKIMNEPTTAATSKFSLHEGTKIRVVENNGNWLLIKLDNGNEGWVEIADVGII